MFAELFGIKKKKKKRSKKLEPTSTSVSACTQIGTVMTSDDMCPLAKLNSCTIVTKLVDDIKHIQSLTKTGSWKYHIESQDFEWSDETYSIFERNKNFPITYNTFLSFVHDEDREKFKEVFAKAIIIGGNHEMIYRIVLLENKNKWVKTNFKIVRSHITNKSCAIGTVQDITAQKISDDSLRRMSKIFTGSEEGSIITDQNGIILDSNAAFSRVTGYSPEEVIGKNPSILKSGIQDADFYSQMWQKVTTDGSWSGEIWNKRKNGEIYPEWLKIFAVFDENKKIVNYVSLFSDISESKNHTDQIQYLAYHDALTGLPNRSKFNNILRLAIEDSITSKSICIVAYLDIDGFKPVNDKFGHNIGDKLLKKVAKRINEGIRNHDTCARIGGDEFVILLTDIHDEKEAELILSRLCSNIAAPFFVDEIPILVSISIGMAICPKQSSEPDILLRYADQAMYAAKRNGKNQIKIFDARLDQKIISKNLLKEQILDAVVNGELELFWQPYFKLTSNEILGAEVLLRWNKNGEIISPASFLNVIDKDEAGTKVGDYVIEETFKHISELNEDSKNHNLFFSINLFQNQLLHDDFESKIFALLKKYPDVNPSQITFEILETTAIDDFNQINNLINRLHAVGIEFAIDDFGTGYSSLTYFSKINAHTIKIDKSFIMRIEDEHTDHGIISSIISLSHNFNKTLIAEGVETDIQKRMLIELGCEIGQGYLFNRPMPYASFKKLLNRQS